MQSAAGGNREAGFSAQQDRDERSGAQTASATTERLVRDVPRGCDSPELRGTNLLVVPVLGG